MLPMQRKKYPLGWRSHIAPIIRAHYNFSCAVCNRSQASLHVHHIDRDTANNSLNNLIPLCPKCHRKAEMGQFQFSQHSRGRSIEEEESCNELIRQVQNMLRAEGEKPIRHKPEQSRK